MSVARVSGFILGTAIGTGDTIANNATDTSAEKDMFGNDTSEGWAHFFLYYTGTAAAGAINVTLYWSQSTGNEATDQAPISASYVPVNGTQKIYLGRWPLSRYMKVAVQNAAIGASLTNVSIGYEGYQES